MHLIIDFPPTAVGFRFNLTDSCASQLCHFKSQKANDFGCRTQENRSSAEGTLGKDPGRQKVSTGAVNSRAKGIDVGTDTSDTVFVESGSIRETVETAA
jgi:hypothetical protein